MRSAIALVLLLTPAPARAQDTEAAYRVLIDDAIAEFNESRFPEARALFRRAHAVSPNARTLRGIGLSSFGMRDYAEAYRSLTAAVASTDRPLTDEQRAEVEAVRTRARPFVGVYRVVTIPDTARLEVDGRPAALDEGVLVLGLGTYQLTARAPGHHDTRRGLEVGGGEDAELAFELVSIAEGEGELASVEETRPVPPPRPITDPRVVEEPPARTDPTAGWLLFSGGAAVAGAGLVTGTSWLTFEQLELDECEAAPGCRNEGDVRTARDGAIVATVILAGIGAGILVAAIVVLAEIARMDAGSAWLCDPGGCTLRF